MSRGIQGLGDDRLAKDTALAMAIIAEDSKRKQPDPTLTDEENAATGPIVSFDLGRFHRETDHRSYDEFTRSGLRHYVESFVLEDEDVLAAPFATFDGMDDCIPLDPAEPAEEISETGDLARLEARRDEAMRIRHESSVSLAHAEDEVERLDAMISRAKKAGLKAEGVTFDKAKVNALEDWVERLQLRLHHARIALSRCANESVGRDTVREIATAGIIKSNPPDGGFKESSS